MSRDTREESTSYVMDFSQIPPGCQFQPSDHQLIQNYLQPKAFSESTMEIIIPDVLVAEAKEFSDLDPFNLPGPSYNTVTAGLSMYRYFFVKRRHERSAGNGYWKATSGDTTIRDGQGRPIGYMKTLKYHIYAKNRTSSSDDIKTPWIMREFRLANGEGDKNTKDSAVWTLCKIGETGRCEKDKACAVDSNTTWQQQVHEKQQTQTEATASYGWVSEPATASYGWVSEPATASYGWVSEPATASYDWVSDEPASPAPTTALMLDATTSGPAVMPLDEPAWMSADDAAMTGQQDEIYGDDDISVENAVNWIADNCTDADYFLY
ncbi:hypothetical protein AQUCO_00300875v1 [Aquilegia coerulea]|uniref:NAC domain-containing protein n=1 Tax=Aquilegia coerulea TaxID=218851 RepID=A0A2G5F0X3_AQUCA|nr:hypothetical protein AQUCO_00300875v1 [Aquilegia coerulea]